MKRYGIRPDAVDRPRKFPYNMIAEFSGGPYDGQRREIPPSEGQNTWTDPTVPDFDFGGHYKKTQDMAEDGKAHLWTWHPVKHKP